MINYFYLEIILIFYIHLTLAVKIQNNLGKELKNEICFDNFGCFSTDYPWKSRYRPIYATPASPLVINTTFYLSTRELNGEDRLLINGSVRKNIEMYFNFHKWTVFIVHGFNSHTNLEWIRKLEDALLQVDDYNVISVDWSKGSRGLNYFQCMSNIRIVGAEITKLIKLLMEKKLTDIDKIHLIGQSLGAHAISYVSQEIKNISKITGLDPAQPGFENQPNLIKLDRTDAKFVEVIHTNTLPFWKNFGLGIKEPIGHVDFFINGGKEQPGCSEIYQQSNISFWNTPIKASNNYVQYLACSHNRAQMYYIESLISLCTFWGRKWKYLGKLPNYDTCTLESCQNFGKYSHLLPGRGTFYVETNEKSPFCNWDKKSERKMFLYLLKMIGKEDKEDIIFLKKRFLSTLRNENFND